MAPEPVETVTIEVTGDEGVPYELTYESDEGSYTQRGTTPDDYAVELTTGARSEDYVRARASKLEGAENVRPTEGDLVNVDLRLVAEDGTVLEEARGDRMLSYSLNQTSVAVDGKDID